METSPGKPRGTTRRSAHLIMWELPAATHGVVGSLSHTIEHRRSLREFDGLALEEADLAQLFWSGQGITDADGLRAAPSAERTYPIELYAAVPEDILHYLPVEHAVESRPYDGDLRCDLMMAALGQPSIAAAGAIFVIVAVMERARHRFGALGERFTMLEAGHVAQNLLLQATALGLRCTPVGNLDDISVQRILGLPSHELPVYLVAVGGPRDRRRG
jgi:SagB-type dehydrogenase family enzyme